jgi:uncharacterized membrane protein HdeD (DUF308 family)
MLLFEMLFGCTLLLSGMLCIIHALLAHPTTQCVSIGYSAGSLFMLSGSVLIFNVVHL